MTIEYYVKDTVTKQILVTCETSVQACARMNLLKAITTHRLAVFYSTDALKQYVEDGQRRFGNA